MRRILDAYPTHRNITKTLLKHIDIRGDVLEPCTGYHQMSSVLAQDERITKVWTNDVVPGYETDYVGDATLEDAECWKKPVENVITNPPFKVAGQILPHAFNCAIEHVAFLLRVTFSEPTKDRGDWLAEHADQMIWHGTFGQKRPNFKRGETSLKTGKLCSGDNATVAWFVWNKNWSWDYYWKKLGINRPSSFAYLMYWDAAK